AIVVPDTEETLLLAEESRSKMIEKQNDPQMTEKKVVTKPINYDILNKLSTDFKTRFMSQTDSSAEQAFWSQYSVQTDESNLSAQAQAKDTVILKLKVKLNSLNGDVKDRDEKQNVEESETLNLELGHQVTKLATENNHLKQTYKKLYDSIKSSRVRSKEKCDDLIKKVDATPVVSKLRKNRTAHIDYLRHTQGEADTLRKIVESERILSPLNTSLDYACGRV
nr:hypothetical protein [Tanacetum cinerariifolium]